MPNDFQLVYVFLPIIFAVACYGEITAHRIPNWLTLGGMALGLGAAAITDGLTGLADSALGLAVGGGVFLPFCLMGVIGGGDMKLMGATGAILGWPLILYALTDTCLAGGILALVIMAWNGVLFSTLGNVFRIIVGMPRRTRGLRNPPMVPYGIAIAAGTLFSLFCRAY